MIRSGDFTQLERQWKILSILSWEPNGLSINQINNRLNRLFGEEVSAKTIKRDIDDLTLAFTISEDGNGKSVIYKLEKFEINKFVVSVEELFSLYFIREIIRKYDESGPGKAALQLIEKMISYLPSIYNEYIDKLYKTFLIQSDINADKNVDKDEIETINKAIIDKKSIRMRYYSFTSNTEMVREVDPYLMYEKDGHYYLTGFCKLHNEVRDFRISRIKKMKILNKSFEISKKFDINKYYEYTWNILKGHETFKVEIKFGGLAARLVREYDKYKADDIIDNGDGSITFIKTVSQLDEIKRWVLGLGSDAQVIEPKIFKDMVNNEILKMAEKIKGN